MSNFEDKYDQIEAFLKGKLSDADRIAFENELQNDPELKDEVAIQKSAYRLLEQDYMQDMSKIIKAQSSIHKSRNIKRLGLVALAALGIGSLFLLVNNKEEKIQKSKNIEQKQLVEAEIETVDKNREKSNSEVKTAQKEVNQQAGKEIKTPSFQLEVPKELKELKIDHKAIAEKTKAIEIQNPGFGVVPPLDSKPKEAEKTPVINCNDKPKVEAKITKASKGEADAALTLHSANSDLTYKLNNGRFEAKSSFNNLSKGKYLLAAKTKDGCEYSIGTYEVQENPCLKETNYLFNPGFDTKLEIDLGVEDKYEVLIYNKLGKMVCKKEVDKSTMFEWDGNYDNLQKADMGVHVLFVKNSNGEMCKYNVVVSE